MTQAEHSDKAEQLKASTLLNTRDKTATYTSVVTLLSVRVIYLAILILFGVAHIASVVCIASLELQGESGSYTQFSVCV